MSLKKEEKDKIKDFLLKTIYYVENYFNIFVIITERTTKEIFDEYTSDDFVFNKTKITVHLAKDYLGYDFVSRSLAKRILMNVEKFKIIVLDFENIDNIGQGFADEVFRVFKNKNPDITIVPVNMNEEIEFMINRAMKNNLK
ncbi:STAS-like domain-containing protein [Fusobacterium animalis]|uniref:STAS-like domain-containing protein n=1 Tax=Fusobacterium animalis TaxID=76859 RepID=UPI001C6E285D|nr:STAS-like domain-containing protein [Fusobacterium animalis]QYR63109.1 STAS-like domain-containing protein [Fusobacterium animalis]